MRKRLNILIVNAYFHPEGGGSENYIHNLSKGLIRRGHRVEALCSTFEREAKEEVIDEIRVVRQRPDFRLFNTAVKFNLALSISKLIKNDHFDLINAHTPVIYYADVAAVISKIYGVPFVLTYHNDNVKDAFPWNIVVNAYNYSFNLLTLNLSKLIITPSPYCYHESVFLERFRRKVTWIPPGVDIKKYRPGKPSRLRDFYHLPETSKIVLFVGRMNKGDRHKGVDCLIRALPQVLNKVKDACLVLAGKGDLLPEYKGLCHSLGISHKVVFTGFVDEDRLIEFYRSSDVTVLPSTTTAEGFGMTLIEGSACGRPVIASAIGGMKYLVQHSIDGFTVPPKDENALAEAITSILSNEQMAKDMGIAGRQKAEQYDWEIITDKTETAFMEVAGV